MKNPDGLNIETIGTHRDNANNIANGREIVIDAHLASIPLFIASSLK